MTAFDYGVLAVLGLSTLIGLWRGLIREVFALLAWVGALVAAVALAPAAATLVAPLTGAGLAAYAVGFAAVLFASLLALGLLGWALSRLIAAVGLGAVDRLLGSMFGLARGLLLVLAFVLAAGLTALPAHPWWQRATLAPVFETAVLAARPWLPADLSRRLRYAVDAARAAARPALAGQSDRRFACAA